MAEADEQVAFDEAARLALETLLRERETLSERLGTLERTVARAMGSGVLDPRLEPATHQVEPAELPPDAALVTLLGEIRAVRSLLELLTTRIIGPLDEL